MIPMKKIITALALTTLVSCGGKEENLSVKTEPVSGSTVKSTFKVWGNCETCKETIEGSLQAEGISEASWNVESKMLSVTYDTTKVKLDQVQKNVAAVGYDNIKYKGDDKAYDNLPECCKYDRK
jgi:periplasmic mercuric ion binding protein